MTQKTNMEKCEAYSGDIASDYSASEKEKLVTCPVGTNCPYYSIKIKDSFLSAEENDTQFKCPGRGLVEKTGRLENSELEKYKLRSTFSDNGIVVLPSIL